MAEIKLKEHKRELENFLFNGEHQSGISGMLDTYAAQKAEKNKRRSRLYTIRAWLRRLLYVFLPPK